jgi:hypothetical protein
MNMQTNNSGAEDGASSPVDQAGVDALGGTPLPALVRDILRAALGDRLDELYQFEPAHPGRAKHAAQNRANALRQIHEVRALAPLLGFDLTASDERIFVREWDKEAEEDKVVGMPSWDDFLAAQERELRLYQEQDRLQQENARLVAQRRALDAQIKANNTKSRKVAGA